METIKYTIKNGKKYLLTGKCNMCGECCPGLSYTKELDTILYLNQESFQRI